jgi:hypothetical protein
MTGQYRSLIFLGFVMCLSLIAGCAIYVFIILRGGDFGWDEAAHALRGLTIAYDIEQGDWLGFWFDTYRQTYWPPLHSWLVGFSFLVTGPSVVSARSVSLIIYVITGSVIYFATRRVDQQFKNLAGFIAALLFLTSPGIIALAAQTMLEIPALFCLILTFFLYFRLVDHNDSTLNHILLGLGITLTYFFRSNYGVLLFLTLFITILINSRFNLRAIFSYNNFYTILPMLIIFSIWFAYPPKLISTLQSMIGEPFGVENPHGIEGFLFYPLSIYRLSGSAWLLLLFLVSLIVAFQFRQDNKIKFLLVFIFLQFFICEFHHVKADRLLMPIMVPFFILAGNMLVYWLHRFLGTKFTLKSWLQLSLLVVLLIHTITVFTTSLNPVPSKSCDDIVRHIALSARETNSKLILGTHDVKCPSPPNLDWKLIIEQNYFKVTQAGSVLPVEEINKLEEFVDRINAPSWLKNAVLPVLRRSEQSGKRSLFIGLPPDSIYSMSQTGFDMFFQNELNAQSLDGVVVITSLNELTRFPLKFVAPSLGKAGLKRIDFRVFKDADTRVDLYQRIE